MGRFSISNFSLYSLTFPYSSDLKTFSQNIQFFFVVSKTEVIRTDIYFNRRKKKQQIYLIDMRFV